MEEISSYATAYRPGGSTKVNANPHVGKPVLLKLDIEPQNKQMIKYKTWLKEQQKVVLKATESNFFVGKIISTKKK